MKRLGIILILTSIAIPLIWTVPLMAQHHSEAILSQYFGIVSLILMGITQLMATRIRLVESVFGSLDRVYVLHKWLGVGALIGAFLHENIDAEAGNITLIRALSDGAEDIAEVAYNGLLFLTLISLITIIPYKYWKWSHRLIGIFFTLAAYHFIYIEKPYAVLDFPGLYVTFFCVMGIASYIYLLIPRAFGHNSMLYTVDNVIRYDKVTEIYLTPQNTGIDHKAGQFAFVNFDLPTLRETHPFTISSAPKADGSLRFLIKGLGSYTQRLGTTLKTGATARVSNAFGHFSLRPTEGPQVWIGGGIGITPFIAWTQTLPDDWETPTQLYYCVRSENEAIGLDEFKAADTRFDAFQFSLIASKIDSRLTAEKIVAELDGDIQTAHVYFCGPTQMRETLRSELINLGLPASNFHNEAFEMRTSLGIVRFLKKRNSR